MLRWMTDILQLLIAEREKLDRAIAALGGSGVKRRGRPPGSKNAVVTANGASPAPARKKRVFTAAQRKQQAQRMKAFWAAKKKAAKRASKTVTA